MKDPLEDALAGMKPAELPPALMARLTAARPQAADAAPARTVSLFRRWLLPLGAGACAAALTLAFLNRAPEPAPRESTAANATPLPVERNDYLVGARHMGVVVGPDQRAYRMVEVEWVEEDTIRPKESGPAVRVETKRRDVIPVALDIY